MANGTFGGGNGTIDNPYLIEDAADLNAIRNNEFITYHYRLKNDIDMKDWLNANMASTGWTPISTFRGVIDGAGFSINNLFSFTWPSALIMNIYGAKIRNLSFRNIWVGTRTWNIGTVAGIVVYMNTSDCLIENCFVQGTINTAGITGGIAASCKLGTIRNCHVDINIEGTSNSMHSTGGIVGTIDGATIRNCYAIGRITQSGTGSSTTVSATIGTGVTTSGPNTITSVFGLDTMFPLATFAGASTRKTITELQTASTFTGWETEEYNSVYKLWRFTTGMTPQLTFLNKEEFLFYANGKYLTYEFNPKTNLLPVMTAETTSGVTITESTFKTSNNGWRIADRTLSPWLVSGTGTWGWVRIDFGSAKEVSCILMEAAYTANTNNYGVKNFRFEGSTNGTTWVTLVSGQHPNTSSPIYYSFTKVSYRYYQLTITDTWNSLSPAGITELGLYSTPQDSWIELGTTLPSDADFIKNGLAQEDLEQIPRLKLKDLMKNSSFDIVCNSDKKSITPSYQTLTLTQDSQISDGVIMKTTLDFTTITTAIREISIK